MLFLEKKLLREYAINEALSNHKLDYYYIEFGVWTGDSINQFANILGDITIYGFDSFEGLREDWVGVALHPKGTLNRNKKPPRLNDNCVPVIGWIQDTLPKFIFENKDLKINFVHIDTDTYPTAKFILQQIKPYLINGSIIIYSKYYRFNMVSNILLLIITIAFNYILIPKYGINGAAIATAISVFLFYTTKMIFVYVKMGMHPFSIKTLYTIFLLLITLFIVSQIPITNNIYLDIIFRSLLAILFFAPFMLWLKLSEDINKVVLDFWRKISQ